MNSWAPERRKRQAAMIHLWKPWEKSTGPKTVARKQRVSQNAFNGGVRPMMRQLAMTLRDQERGVRAT